MTPTNTPRPARQLAAELEDALGQRVTAYAINETEPELIGRLAAGSQAATVEQEAALRGVHDALALVLAEDGAATVRALLFGMNGHLDDQAPVKLLRDGRYAEVRSAMLSHLSGGYA